MEEKGMAGSGPKKRAEGRNFPIRSGMIAFALLATLVSAGCGEVKPLTPEEQSLVSAWKVSESLQKAFDRESVDEVMGLLAPPLSVRPDTRIQLERLFGMFKRINLTLVMDSGEVDSATHSITFSAHWTLTGLPKIGSGPRYFQTGECRMVTSMRKAPAPSRLEDISGD
ncbi:MAG: hypothetical protein D084_Lepto4C00009G0001, partial [Leptospirillum sp. Group IV 'UBA BS']